MWVGANRFCIPATAWQVLAALLLPALGRAKASAQLIRCKSNERQMGMALLAYVQDNRVYPVQQGVEHHLPYFWFQSLEPYSASKWTDHLYDCPSFDFTNREPNALDETQTLAIIQGEYAYNAFGAGTQGPSAGNLGIGRFELWVSSERFTLGQGVPESRVLFPSDMIALGDSYCEQFANLLTGLTLMWGYQMGDDTMRQRARFSARKRHTGVFNILFCDGHVEHLKPSKLFGQGDDQLRRLNSDHQPHRELLQPQFWPIITD